MHSRRITMVAALTVGAAAFAQSASPSANTNPGGSPSTTGTSPQPDSRGSGTMAPSMHGSDTKTGTMPGGTAGTPPASNAMGTTADPAAVLADLHLANQAEVDLGRLAQTKAQNKDVKKFAGHMVKSHTDMDKKAQAFAKKNKITPAGATDAAQTADQQFHQQTKDKLGALSGAEFDKAYMQAMVDDHAKTLEKVTTFENGATSKDFKKLLTGARKEVAEHKREADALLRKVGGTASR